MPAALAAGGRAWRLRLGWAEAGAHRVAVTLGGGGHVAGSPFTICAEPAAACLAASAFEGAGLRQARQALPARQGCRRRQMHVAHADGPVFPGCNFVTLHTDLAEVSCAICFLCQATRNALRELGSPRVHMQARRDAHFAGVWHPQSCMRAWPCSNGLIRPPGAPRPRPRAVRGRPARGIQRPGPRPPWPRIARLRRRLYH